MSVLGNIFEFLDPKPPQLAATPQCLELGLLPPVGGALALINRSHFLRSPKFGFPTKYSLKVGNWKH